MPERLRSSTLALVRLSRSVRSQKRRNSGKIHKVAAGCAASERKGSFAGAHPASIHRFETAACTSPDVLEYLQFSGWLLEIDHIVLHFLPLPPFDLPPPPSRFNARDVIFVSSFAYVHFVPSARQCHLYAFSVYRRYSFIYAYRTPERTYVRHVIFPRVNSTLSRREKKNQFTVCEFLTAVTVRRIIATRRVTGICVKHTVQRICTSNKLFVPRLSQLFSRLFYGTMFA